MVKSGYNSMLFFAYTWFIEFAAADVKAVPTVVDIKISGENVLNAII